MKQTIVASFKPAPTRIGAQVFIEPGQTADDIDDWFRILMENGMTVCRIRMFETHMHQPDGSWNFALYDEAFRAAERRQIKIFATLFPADDTVGGFKYPRNAAHLDEIASYVQAVVGHFSKFPALAVWVLQNEPGGVGKYPDSDLARQLKQKWEAGRAKSDYTSGGFRKTHFDDEEFQRFYISWFLNWYAEQVHQLDPGRHLHVNPHGIFNVLPEYDFSAWRNSFLSSLGVSAHPVWAYSRLFRPEQYALAMSANMDIIRTGAGPLPYWMTELQGGFNLYSGFNAICPRREEVLQWLWLTVGSGADGIIFWTLNQRAAADEPGEWGLITYQREASDRLLAARDVTRTLQARSGTFAGAVVPRSGVTLLLTRESFWTDKKQCLKMPNDCEARNGNAPMKSALAWYEALAENGIIADIAEMDEMDWNRTDWSGEVLILSHQIALPSRQWPCLRQAVERGAKLIIDGLTGYFDEHQVCVMQTGFPLVELLGGAVSEFKVPGEYFDLPFIDGRVLPAHLWQGLIKNKTGEVLAVSGQNVLATRHGVGAGETLWIPSPVALGAWQRDNSALTRLVRDEILSGITKLPVVFEKPEKLTLMRTLKTDDGFVTVLVNNDSTAKQIPLNVRDGLEPFVIFASHNGHVNGRTAALSAGETLVLSWR